MNDVHHLLVLGGVEVPDRAVPGGHVASRPNLGSHGAGQLHHGLGLRLRNRSNLKHAVKMKLIRHVFLLTSSFFLVLQPSIYNA